MKPSDNHSNLLHILQADQLQIPGLNLLGHCIFTKATPPLSWHDHGSSIELIFLLRGRDGYTVDKTDYELAGNEVFVALPNERHKSCGSYQGIGEYIWMQLELSATAEFLNLSTAAAARLRHALQELNQHRYTVSPELMNLVKTFYSAASNGQEPLLCSALLVHLLSSFIFEESRRNPIPGGIDHILSFLHAHFNDSSLSVEDIARANGLSESGLQHKFKNITGDTVVHYLTHLRIQYAKTLLEKGETVLNAAINSGFTSSEYFSVVFKKYNLVSPSAYRRVFMNRDP